MLNRLVGIEIPHGNYDGRPLWTHFLKTAPIDYVLTVLTLGWQRLNADVGSRKAVAPYVEAIRAALSDENLSYRMDDDGSFSYAVDDDFSLQRAETLKGLGHAALTTARDHYEAAFKAMNEPKDTRSAVREMYEAVEVVARLIAPKYKNLNGTMIRGELLQAALSSGEGDDTERKEAWPRMFDSFDDWVSAIHFYRHGQPSGRTVTEDFAVFVMSTGGGYLRLLCKVFAGMKP